MQPSPQPSGRGNAGSANLRAHMPTWLWFCSGLAWCSFYRQGLGSESHYCGARAVSSWDSGCSCDAHVQACPRSRSPREAPNTDLVNKGYFIFCSLVSLSKIRGPNPLIVQCEAVQSLALSFLRQRELETWISLRQPDLLRQIEWSILTKHLRGMDVFVKGWTVSFIIISQLCAVGHFFFLWTACKYATSIWENSQLYVFCNKIWFLSIFLFYDL